MRTAEAESIRSAANRQGIVTDSKAPALRHQLYALVDNLILLYNQRRNIGGCMEITWYGHSCFRLTERGMATVVTDPYDHRAGRL